MGGRSRVRITVGAVLAMGLPCAALDAQAAAPTGRMAAPIGLHVGLPQGEFADNVDVAGAWAAASSSGSRTRSG